jgi:ribosome maturation factor RimP
VKELVSAGLQEWTFMSQTQRERLIEMLEPMIESLGYELFDLELQLEGSGLVRLFVDNLDPEAGIGLEDCAVVSRQVSALLDVEDPIPGDYNLEVSTPGMDRRLVKAQHFERFAGSRVKVKLKRLVEGRRNFKAKLVGCEDSNVLLLEGEVEFKIPLLEIDTARLVPDL